MAGDDHTGERAIAAAVAFVAAHPDRISRLLAIHYRSAGSDLCAGCTTIPTRDPCATRRIALMAEGLVDGRRS